MDEDTLYEDENYIVTTKHFTRKLYRSTYSVSELGWREINLQSIKLGIIFLILGIGAIYFYNILGILFIGLAIYFFKSHLYYEIYNVNDNEIIERMIPVNIAMKLYKYVNIATKSI